MNRFLLIAFCFLMNHSCVDAQQEIDRSRYKSSYEQAIEKYKVPGLAVAIVENDSVVFSDGFGVLSIHNLTPVNSQTIFGIASLTKTFTTAIFANAVADIKIDYDATVKSFLPKFELYDDYVTERITFRDLLSHRSGLGNFSGDLIWYGSRIESDEILQRIRFLKPKYGFRTRFGYSNIFYMLTGKVMENIYHNSYANILDSIVLSPLQMKNTFVSFSDGIHQPNLAKPHIDYNGELISVPYISWDNMLPAGGMFSNVDDLSIYIRMLLNNGELNNRTIISPVQLQENWKPQTNSTLSWLDTYFPARVNFKSYGMGWSMMDFDGHKVLMHSGGLDGMVSQLVIVPDLNAGAVFLVNKASPLPAILMYDWLAKQVNDTVNYIDGALKVMKNYTPTDSSESFEGEIIETMSECSEVYCGEYYDKLVGEAKIYFQNDTLRLKWKESDVFEGILRQKDVNLFELFWPNMKSLGRGELVFNINGNGSVASFQIRLPNPDLHFDELLFKRL